MGHESGATKCSQSGLTHFTSCIRVGASRRKHALVVSVCRRIRPTLEWTPLAADKSRRLHKLPPIGTPANPNTATAYYLPDGNVMCPPAIQVSGPDPSRNSAVLAPCSTIRQISAILRPCGLGHHCNIIRWMRANCTSHHPLTECTSSQHCSTRIRRLCASRRRRCPARAKRMSASEHGWQR